MSIMEIRSTGLSIDSSAKRDTRHIEKYPPHILVPVWLGVIAICLLFWAFILHAIYSSL